MLKIEDHDTALFILSKTLYSQYSKAFNVDF